MRQGTKCSNGSQVTAWLLTRSGLSRRTHSTAEYPLSQVNICPNKPCPRALGAPPRGFPVLLWDWRFGPRATVTLARQVPATPNEIMSDRRQLDLRVDDN